MSFGEHLEELRVALVRSLMGLAVGVVIGFFISKHVIHVVVTPLEASLKNYYIDETAKNKRVLQTGSMQRSSIEFRVAAELVRNGAIGKLERVEVSFGDPGKPCDLKEEDMEPGLDWDRWCGPGPLRGYSSVLSPRGLHNHFPGA